MATKINAAKRTISAGVDMVVADGEDPYIIREILKGENIGTLFVGNK